MENNQVFVVLTQRDTRYGMEAEVQAVFVSEAQAFAYYEELRSQGYYETVTVDLLCVR